MRKLRFGGARTFSSFVPADQPSLAERYSFFGPLRLSDGHHTIESACLFCPEMPCYEFSEDEAKLDTSPSGKRICPTSAISRSQDEQIVTIGSNCIGCGLCVFRCPYGAIFMDESGKARLKPRREAFFRPATREEFCQFSRLFDPKYTVPPAELNRMSFLVKNNLESTAKEQFYPVVRGYLNAIGFPTKLTRYGDTNQRMDAIMLTGKGYIPIEIKSPTETEKVNIEAVRQALENKVVALSRWNASEIRRDTTSLVIAHDRPSSRSDVGELIQDIYDAYRINIGILTVRDLISLLWRKTLLTSFDADQVIYLRGMLDEESHEENQQTIQGS